MCCGEEGKDISPHLEVFAREATHRPQQRRLQRCRLRLKEREEGLQFTVGRCGVVPGCVQKKQRIGRGSDDCRGVDCGSDDYLPSWLDYSGFGRRPWHIRQEEPEKKEVCIVKILEDWIATTRDGYRAKEEDELAL